MKAIEKKLLEAFEPQVLSLVIRGTLSRSEMVRLANASRVGIPGMRNRGVSFTHLSEALADKFVAEGPGRRAILKALQSAVRPELPAYRKLGAEDARLRLADAERLRADTELGKLLLLLILEPKEGIGPEEIRAAAHEALREPPGRDAAEAGEPAAPDGELQALRREKAELSRRAADLVALVDRLRQRDRRFREEIAQRKFDINNMKLQMTRLRKERDSLEKEVRSITVRLDQAEKKPLTLAEISEKMAVALVETRRLAASVEKIHARLPRDDRPSAPAVKALEEIKREAHETRKQIGAERERIVKAIGETGAKLEAAVQGPAAGRAGAAPDAGRRGAIDRVGVFVDVQNMFYAARGQNARLDFDILLQTATRGRRLIRAIAYVVEAKEIDQSGFIALLQQKRYEVKRKDLKVRADGSFKGDWDMEIALDALEMADALDVVVLVTGDGDFTSLVQKLKVRGPRVEVYSFPQNTAKELREAADRFVPIDKRMLIKLARAGPRPVPAGTAGS
jgi:uncharacterized LabA/DUF88 family protein